ncbi:MAG: adenosylcobinamide amidohydrolase [Proteobacteria bacterium]|nr:adenosylcobinamide amidohydrolase [Pseudomonadota bacterium]
MSAAQVPDNADSPTLDDGIRVRSSERWLVVHLPGAHSVASWAIVGGGLSTATAVVWHRVEGSELRPPIDAHQLLGERMVREGLAGAVGLLTSRRLDRYCDTEAIYGSVRARCVATVGLSNAVRIGDPPDSTDSSSPKSGPATVNILCRISTPLRCEALLESLSLAAEARTAALIRAGVRRGTDPLPATGTGTDCIVVAAPDAPSGQSYAGKHTAIGHVIGASVERAVLAGALAWKQERCGGELF